MFKNLLILLCLLLLAGCSMASATYTNTEGESMAVEQGGSIAITYAENGDKTVLITTPDPMPLYKEMIDQNNLILKEASK